MAKITVETCERLVNSVATHCAAAVPTAAPPVAPATPNFDALSAAIAAQSSAIASQANYLTLASLILAAIAALAAIGWGVIVVVRAERKGAQVAKEAAEGYVQTWLATEAPAIVQAHVELLLDATIGNGDDERAADEIGENA